MTVGIYIRVSTEEQVKDGFSISAQRERLKAYCLAQDWNDFKFYVDEGISAKDTNRPQLQKLIKHIEEGKINTVLVYRLDRLTRSVLDLYKLLETFDKYNCTFKSATEVYDTGSAMGRLFITLVAALAQWERENLGERVRMGQIEKARQGQYSAKAPFGFDKDENNRLIINEEEKEIVLMMIDKIRKGYSFRRLANYMDDFGIPPIRGYKWHIRTLMDIMQNHAIYGAVRWLDEIYEDCHPAIITKQEFAELQKMISDRQNFKKRELYSIHIYQMKLLCPDCGNRLTCERSKYFRKRDNKIVENNRYRCQACVLNGRKAVMISEKQMELAFVKYLSELTFDKVPTQKEEESTDHQDLLSQRKKIERQREKYQKAWASDLMTDKEFTERMQETKRILEEIELTINELAPAKENIIIDPDAVKEIVNEFNLNWKHLDAKEKKEFVNRFVESIEFEKKGIAATIKAVHFY